LGRPTFMVGQEAHDAGMKNFSRRKPMTLSALECIRILDLAHAKGITTPVLLEIAGVEDIGELTEKDADALVRRIEEMKRPSSGE